METTRKETYENLLSFFRKTLLIKPRLPLATIYSELVNTLKNSFSYMDWVGFYLVDDSKENLILGPYVGNDACEIININKGVCGKAYKEESTQLVKDVEKIPYHIACSSSTRSEVVIPLFFNGYCLGVLDIDSDSPAAFTADDVKYLKSLCYLILKEYVK